MSAAAFCRACATAHPATPLLACAHCRATFCGEQLEGNTAAPFHRVVDRLGRPRLCGRLYRTGLDSSLHVEDVMGRASA